MNHQLVGRPIGKVKSVSVETSDGVQQFGSGVLWDDRTLKVVEAIRAGDVEGEVYSDGEVWVNTQSLTGFLARHIPA